MALYRKGKVTLDSSGIIKGFGTKWTEKLSLIRTGATMIIASNPVTYLTISEIINDDTMRAINYGGATVDQQTDYIILIHDSITVDGLAQDVAETLRYYQGKETEFAHFIEVIKTLDIEELEKLVDRIKEEIEKFEQNFVKIEAKAKEVADNAEKVAADKDAVVLLHNQVGVMRDEASQSAQVAQEQVALAETEVSKAKGEVAKAAAEVGKAQTEVRNAAAEVEKARQVVATAKTEVLEAAAEEVGKAAEQVKLAAAEVSKAKVEADRANGEANRAKTYADEIKDIGLSFDVTNLVRKDKNLSDLTNFAEARRNLGVDNIEHNDLETKVMTENKDYWLSLRNRAGEPWGVYNGVAKRWIALGVGQGGTGANDAPGARKNLGLDRVQQDANMTRIFSEDMKTELRIGQDEWFVYRESDDSEAGFVALPVKGGGTGGTNPTEAKANLEIDRLVQSPTSTTVGRDGGNRLAVNDAGDWGALDGSGNWIALGVKKGGTGSSDPAGARKNLGLERFIQDDNMTRIKANDGKTEMRIGFDDWYVYRDSQDSEAGYVALGVNGGGTGANDAAGARANLGIGESNVVTFSQVKAPNGLITTTASNAENTNPAAPWVNQLLDASGKVISQGEFRADRNGNVSIINRGGANPQFMTLSQNGDVTVPRLISSAQVEANHMELGQRVKNSPAYIDFHYGGKYDFDARIICDGYNFDQQGGGSLHALCGYFRVLSMARARIGDNGLHVRGNGATVLVEPNGANQACYVLGRSETGANQWYVGRGGSGNEVSYHNYATGAQVQLSDRIKHIGKDTEVQNLFVNGSSVYIRGGSGAANTHLWLQNSSGRNRAVIYSSDTQMLQLRSDNSSTNASGQALSINGATGECRAVKFTATSDERAKFWIKPVTGALDKVCSLRGVTYSMHTTIQNTVRNAGVIAQDVQKVLPEAVSVNETKDHNVLNKNCDKVDKPLTLDYNALSALYIEAIKELKAEVDALKAEIAELKNNK